MRPRIGSLLVTALLVGGVVAMRTLVESEQPVPVPQAAVAVHMPLRPCGGGRPPPLYPDLVARTFLAQQKKPGRVSTQGR